MPPSPAPLSDNVRGMLWMLLTAFLLTVAAAQAKQLGQRLPIAEVVCFRMALGFLFMLPWMLRGGIANLATQRLKIHFWRAALGIGSYVLYIYAISNMMLANAVALAFSTPLWMILVSRLTLGERAGWARGLATFAGFVGILIIARPDVEISLPALAALAAALLLSLAMISVKRLSATDSSAKIAFYLQVFGTLFTLPNTVVSWVPPTPDRVGQPGRPRHGRHRRSGHPGPGLRHRRADRRGAGRFHPACRWPSSSASSFSPNCPTPSPSPEWR